MNSKVTDVFIHTRERLSEGQFVALSEQVYREQGIVSITRNFHRPSLLMVVYDAARTGSMGILERIRNLGYEATLVAM